MPSVTPAGYFVAGLHESMPETKVVTLANSGTSFFGHLLDIINPLQHIPVVSTLYRAITGDEITGAARLIGGTLFGGPIGFASAAANVLLEEIAGDDLPGLAVALVDEFDGAPEMAASATPAAADTATPQLKPTALAAVDGAEAIVWNGPRVLPSLAHTAAATPNQGAAASASAPPIWIDAAIADAQSVRGAAQTGQAAPRPGAQPWVADAMLDGLAKYEAMARARNR